MTTDCWRRVRRRTVCTCYHWLSECWSARRPSNGYDDRITNRLASAPVVMGGDAAAERHVGRQA